MNKKSIFFTFTAILMVSVIVLAFTSQTYVTMKNRIAVTKHRVQLANNYINSIESIYLKRALYATGYRALYAMAMDINKTGSPSESPLFFDNKENFEQNFQSAILKAEIRGSESGIMKGKTIIDTLKILENLSQDAYHINTTFEKNPDKIKVVVFQNDKTGPWQVGVNMSISYFVDADLAEWNISSQVIEAVFSISGLDDPMYMFNTGKVFTNHINQAPFKTWNITNLNASIINRTYKYDSKVPNFLMRFYNDNSQSLCCGIESLVYPEILKVQPTLDKGNSFVDCAYWGGGCGEGRLFNITGITHYPDYPFRLDFDHVISYNVADKTY